jgi:hypothetical protein
MDAVGRKILYTSDGYHIVDGRLYRVTEARTKRQRNIRRIATHLCIPQKFQCEVVTQCHQLLNLAVTDKRLAKLKSKWCCENIKFFFCIRSSTPLHVMKEN